MIDFSDENSPKTNRLIQLELTLPQAVSALDAVERLLKYLDSAAQRTPSSMMRYAMARELRAMLLAVMPTDVTGVGADGETTEEEGADQ